MRISQFPHISPRLWDTDGDGIADPSDLDPRRDCVVEVEIGKASVPRSYIKDKYGGKVNKFDRLQAGIVLGSSFDHQGIYTKKEDATITGTKSTKDFKDKYYFDINDDVRTFRLDKVMLFGQLQGYHSRGWYPVELDGSRAARTFRFQTSEKEESKTFGSGSRYVELDYKVVTLERAHTIHVYENGTYSERYGRYYTPEKMAVLQLHITSENTAGSPFVTGLNTILTPSSAFLNSQLNSIVQTVGSANQTEYDEKVPDCLKSETGKTEFQGIDRSNPDEQMSDQIEVMLTKHDCSLYHAKQILNLTLTGIVNESSDQLGILYEYDANATHPAELANLAYDVLKAVPVLSTYHNSPTGNAPRIADRLVKKSMGELLAGIDWWNLKDWIDTIKEMWARLMSWFESLIEAFLDLLSDLVAFVMDAVQKVAEALGNLVQAVAKSGLTLVKAVAAAAMEALENLLKAALLTFLYTMFAITLLFVTLSISIIFVITVIFSEPLGYSITYSTHRISIRNEKSSIQIGYSTQMEYNNFLDLKIPSVTIFFKLGEMSLFIPFNFYTLGLEAEGANSTQQNSEISDVQTLENGDPQTLESSLPPSEEEGLSSLTEVLAHMTFFMEVFGATLAIIGGMMIMGKTFREELLGIGLLSLSVGLFTGSYLEKCLNNEFIKPFDVFLGLMLGGIFCGVACIILQGVSILSWPTFLFTLSDLDTVWGGISLFLSSVGLGVPWEWADLIIEISRIPVSFLVLLGGLAIVSQMRNTQRRDRVLLACAAISFFAPLAIMFMIAGLK